jgi:hypothetical protein
MDKLRDLDIPLCVVGSIGPDLMGSPVSELTTWHGLERPSTT